MAATETHVEEFSRILSEVDDDVPTAVMDLLSDLSLQIGLDRSEWIEFLYGMQLKVTQEIEAAKAVK